MHEHREIDISDPREHRSVPTDACNRNLVSQFMKTQRSKADFAGGQNRPLHRRTSNI
jgi:hypothetical protein